MAKLTTGVVPSKNTGDNFTSTEFEAVRTSINAAYDAVDSEATARAAADTTLQTNITAEATTRAAADTAINTAIASKQDVITDDGLPATKVAQTDTRKFVTATEKTAIGNVAALTRFAKEDAAGIYEPILSALGLSSATGLSDHANGGLVAAVAGVAGTGSLLMPKAIDPSKPWHFAALIEINDSNNMSLQFTNDAAEYQCGLRLTGISTTGISADWNGGATLLGAYGNTGGIPAGTKLWIGLASDGNNVNFFLMPFANMNRLGVQDSIPAYATAYSGISITKYTPNSSTYVSNGITKKCWGGSGIDIAQRLCRFVFTNASTTNRVIGIYCKQSLNGPSDGQFQPPFILTNMKVLNDTTGWIVKPGSQNYSPTSLVMCLHPNASDTHANVSNVGYQGSFGVSLYNAGYLLFGTLGSSNRAGYTDATASNWGAAAGMRYRKAQLEFIRQNIAGTNNLFLYGQSMGLMNALTYVAQFPNSVKAVYGVSGVCDLADSYSNRGFSATIQKSYGSWWLSLTANTGVRPDQIVTLSAAAIVGATSISVTALAAAIPSGTTLTLNGGTGQTTVVTSAAAASGATSITVTALTTAISSGATYNMSAHWLRIAYGNGAPDDSYYADTYTWRDAYASGTTYSANDIVTIASTITAAQLAWIDPNLKPYQFKNTPIIIAQGVGDNLIPPVQSANFSSAVNAKGGNVVVKKLTVTTTASAASGATSVAVASTGTLMNGALPIGTVLTLLTGTGTGQATVTLTAAFNLADTTMQVSALTSSIASGCQYGLDHLNANLYNGADAVSFFNANNN